MVILDYTVVRFCQYTRGQAEAGGIRFEETPPTKTEITGSRWQVGLSDVKR